MKRTSKTTTDPKVGSQRHSRRRIHILLSEGSSLSARQTITALGKSGYVLDVCDPNPLFISRFSRFVRRSFRCPAAGTDPLGYLEFILDLLRRHHYDVLLPVHEQAFLFAKVRNRLPAGIHLALAPFDSFLQVQGKVGFVRLMDQLSLPQPPTHIVRARMELDVVDHFPSYLKTDLSTAGQGVWRVTNKSELDQVALMLDELGLLSETHQIIVQQEASGVLCQAQAVFAHGQLKAVHCTQTRGVSVGGGHAARIGVDHPVVHDHLVTLGQVLQWHGPLSLDYFFDETTRTPSYIECNPRLVEPMNATLSGVNLADLTVRVALGEMEASTPPQYGEPGIRSHSLLAILLGRADHGASRWELVQTLTENIQGHGIFANSREDLTPVHLDPPSLIPLTLVTGQLLLRPHMAHRIATGAITSYSLTAASVETIMALNGK
jgi:hypothetical protein